MSCRKRKSKITKESVIKQKKRETRIISVRGSLFLLFAPNDMWFYCNSSVN